MSKWPWKEGREWVVAVAAVVAAAAGVATWLITQSQGSTPSQGSNERAQAEQVSAEIFATASSCSGCPPGFPVSNRGGRRVTYIELINNSGQPVHNAVVNLVFVQGAAPRTGREQFQFFRSVHRPNPFYRTLAVIPPGDSWTYVPGDWPGMFRVPGAEVTFTDQQGRNWLRSASGALTRINQSAASYYRIPLPAVWVVPQTNRPH